MALPKFSTSTSLSPISSSSGSTLPKFGNSSQTEVTGLPKLGQVQETAMDKFSGFTQSFLESVPELFGIEPSFETEQYRAKNPIGSFVSQGAGYLVPYLGEAKALKGVKALEGAYDAIKTINNPIARGAAQAALETSIFEGTRLAASATPIPGAITSAITGEDKERTKPLTEIAGEGGLNILGAGALGGVFGGLGAKFARGEKISNLVPEAAPDRPLVRQIQAIDDALENGKFTSDQTEKLIAERNRRVRYNLLDTRISHADDEVASVAPGYVDMDGKLFRPLQGQTKSNDIGGFLNRAQRWTGDKKYTTTMRAIYEPSASGGFSSREALDGALAAAQTSQQELGKWAQNIRVLEVNPQAEGSIPSARAARDTRAASIEKRFTNKKIWTPVDGWSMAQEKDGLYVMAKKVAGQLGDPKPGDQWLFFRTANPEKFAKTASNLKVFENINPFFPKPEEVAKIAEPTWDTLTDAQKLLEEGRPLKASTAKGKVAGAIEDSAETMANYTSPTTMLAGRNPKLNIAVDLMRTAQNLIHTRVHNFLHGEHVFEPGESLLKHVSRISTGRTASFADLIRTATKDDLKDIQTIIEEQIPFDKVTEAAHQGVISPTTHAILTTLEGKSKELFGRLAKLDEVVGIPSAKKLLGDFAERQGHYGITRDRVGKFATYINDTAGNLVGKVAGNSPQEALEKAQAFIDRDGGRSGELAIAGTVSDVLRTPENLEMLKASARKPGFTKERGNLLGADYSTKEWNHQDLIKLVEKNLVRRENYIRDVALEEKLASTFAQLEREAPQDAVVLRNKLNNLRGDEGKFARVQNEIMDKALQSVGFAGSDSASGIVRATQKLMNAAQFGFLNITNPLLNVIGTLQTVIPELAYGLHVSPETLARNYASVPVFNKAGQVKGSIGMLSPFKLFGNAMKWLATPFKDMPPDLQRTIKELAADGTLTARGVEEQFGVDGHILKNPIQALKSGGDFTRLINSSNELLTTKSEELGRAIAIMSGYELALARNLPVARIPYFVRSFVHKTMYSYATADKASVFTTPLGSLAGTFKNWLFHYMANMVKYAKGGKETLPALFWQTATTGLVAGTAGTPLLMPLLNGASQFLTDNSAMQNLYAAAGPDHENWADGVMYGLPGLMGLSLSSQAATPGSDPQRDANMVFSFAIAQRMKNLSDASKDALESYTLTGRSPFEDPIVRNELARALAPRTIYRAIAASQNGEISSPTTGAPVIEDLSPGARAAYAFGFNPVDLDKTYAVYSEIRDDQAAQKDAVSALGRALADAWNADDQDAADRINARAMALGLDYSSVLRSAKAFDKRSQVTQLESSTKPEDREAFSFMFNQPEDSSNTEPQ